MSGRPADAARYGADPTTVSDACLLSPKVCAAFANNSLAIYTALWCIVNGIWELMTWATQIYQVRAIVCRASRGVRSTHHVARGDACACAGVNRLRRGRR